jgi:hypothetical protein
MHMKHFYVSHKMWEIFRRGMSQLKEYFTCDRQIMIRKLNFLQALL